MNQPPCIRYFGLVITNQQFESAKIPDLHKSVLADHDKLSNTMSHPYLCKFAEDDCIFLKDASLSALVNSFETIEGKMGVAIEALRRSEEQGRVVEEDPSSPKNEKDKDKGKDKDTDNDNDAESVDDSIVSAGAASPKSISKSISISIASPSPSERSLGSSSSPSRGAPPSPSPSLASASAIAIAATPPQVQDTTFEEFDSKQTQRLKRLAIAASIQKQPVEARFGFFIYFCTHALTIQKSGTLDGMYFMLHDTSWNSSAQVRKSSLSLAKFCSFVKKIPCLHKTTLLDVVHLDRPKDTMFKTKIMYPQPEIYDKIATQGGTTCIGSCMSGLTGAQAMKYMMNKKKLKSKGGEVDLDVDFDDVDEGSNSNSSSNSNSNSNSNSSIKKSQSNVNVLSSGRFNRGSMLVLKQDLAMKQREEISNLSAKKKTSKPNPLKRLSLGFHARITSTKSSYNNMVSLPPPTLTWTNDNGYKIEVMDSTDVFFAAPMKFRNFLKRKRKEVSE